MITGLLESAFSSRNWFDDVLYQLGIENNGGWPDKFGELLYSLMKHKVNVNVLSLFSGAGGLDIGFHESGFNIVECVEIEDIFSQTLKLNIGSILPIGTLVHNIDIRKYIPKNKNIDFIIGGPPCQTFSAAGARVAGVKGVNDKRGTLFEEYVRLLELIRPTGFLFENVYRLVGAQNGKPWKMITEAFAKAGYKLFYRILDSADFGVPQHRERLFIIGIKEGCFLFPEPTHGPDSVNKKPYYTAGLALSGLLVKNIPDKLKGRHGYLLENIPPGLNYSYYTEEMGHPRPIFGWRTKFSDYLYKADPDEPVRTIKAQGGQYTGPLSWENRHFSVEELKRLQTFPDKYKFFGSKQDIIKQIGNSVPPQLSRVLALSVLEQIFNVELPFKIKSLNEDKELAFRKRKRLLTHKYRSKAKVYIEKQIEDGSISIEQKNGKKHNEEDIKLNENLIIQVDKEQISSLKIKYNLTETSWGFYLVNKNSNSDTFQIKIRLNDTLSGILNTKQISLLSYTDEKFSISLLWQYLLLKIREFTYKEDLVQLFGYYTSSKKHDIDIRFNNEKLLQSSYWKLILEITNGSIVGKPIHISDISTIIGVKQEQLIHDSLVELKRYGYEIRNRNTNSELKLNYYLIPYRFPTLNERSLQKLTVL